MLKCLPNYEDSSIKKIKNDTFFVKSVSLGKRYRKSLKCLILKDLNVSLGAYARKLVQIFEAKDENQRIRFANFKLISVPLLQLSVSLTKRCGTLALETTHDSVKDGPGK